MRLPRAAACVSVSVGLVLLAAPDTASARPTPLSTAFAYQGSLKAGGAAFSGVAEFQFRLYDAVTAGNQIGSQIALIGGSAPAVSDGLFSVTLNFGATAFNGDARWLEVDVRTGLGSFTTLSPRQALSATPYALQTRGLFVDASNNVGIGTSTPGTRLHIKGADEGLRIDGTGVAAANNAYISFQDSNGIRIGYVGDGSSGDSSIYLESDTGDVHLYPGGPVLTAKSNGRVGIGTTTPSAPLHVRTTGPFMVLQDMASAANQAGYVAFWNNTPTETAWVGFGSPGNPDFSIVNARAGGDIILSAFNGRVGIGTSTPTHTLTVGGGMAVDRSNGDGMHYGTINVLELNMTAPSNGQSFVRFSAGGFGQTVGNIAYVSGGGVSYNGFMGSHYGWMEEGQSMIDRGTLVRMIGENRRLNDSAESDVVYGIEPTASANDPACLGAYLGIMKSDQPGGTENLHLVAAVGNGEMLVVETGTGDIQPGDYLISGDVAGCAMKDDPKRFPVGHVIARAAEAVDWAGVTELVAGRRVQRISVFFESFERGSAADAEIASLRAEKDGQIAALEQDNQQLRDRLAALEAAVARLSAGQHGR